MDLSQMSQLETVAMSTPQTANIEMTGASGSPISPVMPGPHLEDSMVSKASKASSAGKSYMKELDRVNDQQSVLSAKLAKEKKRELKLKADLRETEDNIWKLKNSSGNGNQIRAREMATKKQINKLEKLVMVTRNKLSSARTENSDLKQKIDDKRKDKQLILHIYHELQEELEKTVTKTDDYSTKINELHEKKHRVGLDLQNVKEQMVKSMEGFSRELDTVKETIEYNQNSLLEGIKDKLLFSSQHYLSTPRRSPAKEVAYEASVDKQPETNPLEDEINTLLRETGVETKEELMAILQGDEDETFATYRDVQDQTEEVERLDTEVKHLEDSLKTQEGKVEELEQNNNAIRSQLDSHIQAIQKQIMKYETTCKTNSNVLLALSESVVNLLRSLSNEGNSQHQTLLNAGVTERNVSEFLSVVEERIDYVIQMTKAAGKVHLNSDDFKTKEMTERKRVQEMIPHLPQMLETTQLEEDDIDTGEDSKLKPVDVKALKEYMIKKVNKMAAANEAPSLDRKATSKKRHGQHDNSEHRRNNKSDSIAQHSIDNHGSIALPPKEPKSKGFSGRKSHVKSNTSRRLSVSVA